MRVDEIAPGLWRWTAPHPGWEPDPEPESPADWPREVGCVYYEASEAVVLIDPLVPPERDTFLEALDRDVERLGLPLAILLTVSWHERSAGELAARFGAAFAAPTGVVELPVPSAEETVYWLPERGTLVVGDVLIADGAGGLRVCPDSWLPEGTDPAAVRETLRPLLELPIERVLASHGAPVLVGGGVALELALDRVPAR
ncbi:MAG: hypothetical protein H0T61_04870 [Actinobacteria bacterium]|nr:hypothetical protein [Actinomycetota bacterium]